jgi:4-amino-4-deoxy-L-arabinose transferase-like glycosyltransferase
MHSATENGRLAGLGPSLATRDVIVLFFILAAAAAFRLWDFRQPLVDGFSWREASTAMMADNFRTRSWNIFFPEVSWTGPGQSYQGREFQLFSYSVAILQAIFGWHDWFGRVVAAFFGLITVLSLHRLVAQIWDEFHAHLVALAYALTPAAIMMDSSFIPDPAMLSFATTGVWLFVRYWVNGNPTNLVLSTLTFTLAALSKPPGLAVELVVLYFTAVSLWRGDRRKAAAILVGISFTLLVVVSYFAWAIYLGNSYPPYHVAGYGYIWQSGVGKFLRQKYSLGSSGRRPFGGSTATHS